jgi:ABC-type bacteriocin/lantibiotic exporter with double-glycine peptidase domain
MSTHASKQQWWSRFVPGGHRVPELLQFETTECGATCVAMVLAYFGRWEPIDSLRQICGTTRDGISAGALVRAGRLLNLQAKGFGVPATELGTLPMPQILFWNFNHFVVLERIKGELVDIVDPAVGRRRLSMADIERGYSGVTLCMAPSPDFAVSGRAPSVFREVVRASNGAGFAIAMTALVSLGIAILTALIPALTSIFIDYVLIKRGIDSWQSWFIAGVVLFGLILGPAVWMQRLGILRLQTQLTLVLATRIVTHLFAVPLNYFSRRSGGEIGGRVLLADSVANTVSGALVSSISSTLQILVLGLTMALYSLPITAIVFALLLAHALVARTLMLRSIHLVRLMAVERGRYESQVINAISLMEHSRASGTQQALLQGVLDRYVATVNAEQRIAPFSATMSVLPSVTLGVLMAIMTGLAAHQVIIGEFSVGVFVAYSAMTYLLIVPFNQLVQAQVQVTGAAGNFDRLNDLLDFVPESPQPVEGPIPERWSLSAKSLGYAFGIQPVLNQLDLHVPQGSYLGLAGAVGSGKSTLINLLAGAYHPTEGEVLVDDIPLQQLGMAVRAKSVVLVSQQAYLFAGTVMDNLTMWDPSINEKDVIDACRICLIHEDILQRPGGYRSRLTEGGGNFSGGQRQRLALARAVARKPRILLLDESTSGLDGLTEAMVLENLRGLGITLVFATHRVSNLRNADTIIVMSGGHISESGSPKALLTRRGLYTDLVNASGGGSV